MEPGRFGEADGGEDEEEGGEEDPSGEVVVGDVLEGGGTFRTQNQGAVPEIAWWKGEVNREKIYMLMILN